MKSLYINNKRVTLDNTYFPFTYKISDLEEVNIIGVPQSKTVEIKRLPENDEIFGYIGEIHRSTFNFTEDNLVGSSFNQTKKAYYELFQDSELVSSGQVQVTGVNEENYEITLYDTLIDLLEQFEGNSDTDKGYLSSLDIIKYDNSVFSTQTNALNVYNLNNDSVDVVPVVNITEFETSGSEIRCLDSVTALPINATLPGEFTPIQARTLKNYEVEYAVPINTVIRSINKYDLEGINPNLLKNTTDAWTNDTIADTTSYAFLTDGISKAAVGFETGKTYTFSLVGEDFPDGQYYIALITNNGGVYTYHAGSLVSNGERSSITYIIPSDFIEVYIYLTNNNVPVVGDTVIKYKEVKIEEGTEATKYIHNITDDFSYEYIKVEEGLNTLFDEVHLNCGKPKKDEIPFTEEFVVDTIGTDIFDTTNYLIDKKYYHPLNNNDVNYVKKNGNYYMIIPITCKFEYYYPNVGYSHTLTKYNGVTYVNAPVSGKVVPIAGNKIGEIFIDTFISGFNRTSKKYESLSIRNQIEIVFGNNFNYTVTGDNKVVDMTITGELVLSYDMYPELYDLNNITTNLSILYDNMFTSTQLFDTDVQYQLKITSTVGNGIGTFKTLPDLRTNDYFDGKMILPKVPIKDFIINLCKFYNLDIVNSNNSLLIRRKRYFKTNEVLRIAKLNSIDVNLFNFNKLILTTDVSSNTLIDTYNKSTKQVYGQKVINTGYAIKSNSKKVNIPIGVPSLILDTNKLAYNSFGNYFNAGRSRGKYGVTEGFEDKLVFGYLNQIKNDLNQVTNDFIYVTNDTYYEGGMWSSAEPANFPDSISFKMNNQKLIFNSITDSFTFINNSSTNGQAIRLNKFFTISPYKFDDTGLIIESLEMNKPKYNYAGITDEKYDETVTLYDRYHKKMIEDRYNVDTNIIDVDIYMDSMPNVYAIYNIKGTNYIISELSEYDPSTDGEIFEGIKLLKVNNVYNYGVSDYYNVELTQKLTFDGNIGATADRLLGFDYGTYGSSEDITDNYKLLSSNFSANSVVNITYDNDLDTTTVSQTNKSMFEVTPDYINKIKVSGTAFNYIADYVQQQYLLDNGESFTLIDEEGAGIFNQQTLNQPLYLRSGNKTITEAGIYDPIKANLECIQSGGLYYWLITGECILRLNSSVGSLSSASKFKFDNISIEAKEEIGDPTYTVFTWGHSDLSDVNYTYFSDGSLKFTFKAMLFQGSSFSGTLPDNVRDMWVVPFPDSGYTVKISLDGTYNDFIDAEDESIINFGDFNSNLSYTLNTFTGNNEILTTITATNYEVAYTYNK